MAGTHVGGHLDFLPLPKTLRQVSLRLLSNLPWLALVISNFQPSLLAIEGNSIPFKGHKGIQRVTHLRTVRVFHHCSHRIVDIDVFAEDATIAVVTVYILTTGIELHSLWSLCHIGVESSLITVLTRPPILRN